MNNKQRISVFGAGGHSKVVVDAIKCNSSFLLSYIVDDAPDNRDLILGHAVSGSRETLLANRTSIDTVIVAIGNNQARTSVANWLISHGFTLATITHPASIIAVSSRIGAGSLIMPGAVVNADVLIGGNTIINTSAVIEHDCVVGDGAHIAPGAVLCGGVHIGQNVLVGAGAVILPGVHVGCGTLVKAGSVVKRDLEPIR